MKNLAALLLRPGKLQGGRDDESSHAISDALVDALDHDVLFNVHGEVSVLDLGQGSSGADRTGGENVPGT